MYTSTCQDLILPSVQHAVKAQLVGPVNPERSTLLGHKDLVQLRIDRDAAGQDAHRVDHCISF